MKNVLSFEEMIIEVEQNDEEKHTKKLNEWRVLSLATTITLRKNNEGEIYTCLFIFSTTISIYFPQE